MRRYLFTAAAALLLLSGAASAETLSDGSNTKKIVTRVSPNGVTKSITRHHADRYGKLITHRKTVTEGMSGSSVNRTRTVAEPDTGKTITKSTTAVH
jgi:hypothetical protein